MAITLIQLSLILFLLLNLVIGTYGTYQTTHIDEYVKANKKLGGGALIATLAATLLDASNMGIKNGYETGLFSIRNPILLALVALFLGIKIFPNITQFSDEYTIAELMYTFFGPFARYFTAFVSFFFCFLMMVMQLVIWGDLSSLVGFSSLLMILMMGLVVTLYTLLGGIRAVVRTDIFQLVVIIIGSIFFFLGVFRQSGGIQKILAAVPENSQYDTIFSYPNIMEWVLSSCFFSFFPIILISPPVVQRILMTENKKKIKNMFTSFAIFYVVFRFLMLVVSFKRFSIPNSLLSVKGVPIGEVVRMLSSCSICQLLFTLLACSVVMSTVDSLLHSTATILANDIITTPSKNRVKIIQLASFLLGVAVIITALLVKKWNFLIFFSYGAICLSSIAIPFLSVLAGLKGSKKSFLAHLIVFWATILVPFGCIKMGIPFLLKIVKSIIIFTKIGDTFGGVHGNINTFLALWYIAIITSTITFLVTHYVEYGGFLFVKRIQNMWVPQGQYTIQRFFKWILHPVQWANEKVACMRDRSFSFAMIVIGYYMLPYWTDPSATLLSYYGLYLLRVSAVLVVLGALIGRKMWATTLQPYYYLYYQWAVFFCITFINTLTTISDLNNPIAPLYLAFNILTTAYLVDWSTFWLFHGLGILGSLLIHKAIVGKYTTTVQDEYIVPIIASIALPLAIAIFFIRWNRNEYWILKSRNNALEEEKKKILISITENADQLSQAIQKDSIMMKKMQKNFGILALKVGDTAEIEAIKNAVAYFHKKSEEVQKNLCMNVQKIFLDMLFDDVWHELKNKGVYPVEYPIQLEKNNYSTAIIGNLYYLKRLLVTATEYAMKNRPKNELKISLEDVYIQYDLPSIYKKNPKKALKIVITNTKKIVNKKLYKPYEELKEKPNYMPSELRNNLRIIKAHFGFFSLAKYKEEVIQTYVIPLNLKAMPPKVDAFVYEDLFDEVIIDTPEDLAFLARVSQKGINSKKIKLAMQVTKHYHFFKKGRPGKSYYLNLLSKATILLDYTDNPLLIIAALLHNTLEETPYKVSQMQAMFGERVTGIVQEIAHFYSKEEEPRIALKKQEILSLLIKKGDNDALLIKLIDGLYYIRTIKGVSRIEKRKNITKEAEKILIPIASKLKLTAIENELKNRVQAILENKLLSF